MPKPGTAAAKAAAAAKTMSAAKSEHPYGRIVTGANDGVAAVWSVCCGDRLTAWRAHDGAVTALVTMPNSDVVSAGTDGKIRCWAMIEDENTREINSKILKAAVDKGEKKAKDRAARRKRREGRERRRRARDRRVAARQRKLGEVIEQELTAIATTRSLSDLSGDLGDSGSNRTTSANMTDAGESDTIGASASNGSGASNGSAVERLKRDYYPLGVPQSVLYQFARLPVPQSVTEKEQEAEALIAAVALTEAANRVNTEAAAKKDKKSSRGRKTRRSRRGASAANDRQEGSDEFGEPMLPGERGSVMMASSSSSDSDSDDDNADDDNNGDSDSGDSDNEDNDNNTAVALPSTSTEVLFHINNLNKTYLT